MDGHSGLHVCVVDGVSVVVLVHERGISVHPEAERGSLWTLISEREKKKRSRSSGVVGNGGLISLGSFGIGVRFSEAGVLEADNFGCDCYLLIPTSRLSLHLNNFTSLPTTISLTMPYYHGVPSSTLDTSMRVVLQSRSYVFDGNKPYAWHITFSFAMASFISCWLSHLFQLPLIRAFIIDQAHLIDYMEQCALTSLVS